MHCPNNSEKLGHTRNHLLLTLLRKEQQDWKKKKCYIWRSNTLRYEIIYLARNKSYCDFRDRNCHCDLNSAREIYLRIQNLRIHSAAPKC